MAEIVEIVVSGGACSPVAVISGSANPVAFIEADTTLHNSSPDLQGGGNNEFYHLTSGQYSFVTGLYTDKIDPTNDVIFEKNVTISGTLLQGTGYNNYLTGLRVVADGKFSIDGDAQYSEFILKTETTNAVSQELKFTNSSKKLSLPDNTSWYFKLRVIAKDTANNTAIFNSDGAIKKGASAGFTQIVGNLQTTRFADEIGCGGIVISADTSYGYLKIEVVGKIGTTIRWVGYLNLTEVR
jgi:hypothetical protein